MVEKLIIGSKSYLVNLRKSGSNFSLDIDNQNYQGNFSKVSDGSLNLKMNNIRSICYSEKSGDEIYVFVNGVNYFLRRSHHRTFSSEQDEENSKVVLSPITGKLLSKKILEGSQVSKGEVIIILEAMKMEHRLTSPQDGILTKLTSAKVGGQVKEGELMFELEDQ